METKCGRQDGTAELDRDRSLEVTREVLEAEILPRYSNAHDRALDQAEFLRKLASDPLFGESAYTALNALRQCGAWLEFQQDLDGDGATRLISGHLCKYYKLCPLCAMRRCGRGMAKYSAAIENAIAEWEDGRLVPVFVTLTIRNGPELGERFDELNNAKRAFMRRRRDALRGKGDLWLATIEGGVNSVEVKRGSGSGLWHPHIHSIWLVRVSSDDARTNRQLARDVTENIKRHWREIADGFIVDARSMHDEHHFSKSITECFKYATKFSTMTCDEAWYCHLTTKGRRYLSSFGVLRGLGEPDGGEDMTRDDIEWIRLHYKYEDAGGVQPYYDLVSEERRGHECK